MTEMATEEDMRTTKEIMSSMSDENKKALKGWYFYDWANQAYALTVMTVIAPALMASLYNTATGTQSGDSFYAWILTISMVFVVVTAPALGVIADKMPIKKKLLKWYTVAGILFSLATINTSFLIVTSFYVCVSFSTRCYHSTVDGGVSDSRCACFR